MKWIAQGFVLANIGEKLCIFVKKSKKLYTVQYNNSNFKLQATKKLALFVQIQ